MAARGHRSAMSPTLFGRAFSGAAILSQKNISRGRSPSHVTNFETGYGSGQGPVGVEDAGEDEFFDFPGEEHGDGDGQKDHEHDDPERALIEEREDIVNEAREIVETAQDEKADEDKAGGHQQVIVHFGEQ